jgi:hypothetical protein
MHMATAKLTKAVLLRGTSPIAAPPPYLSLRLLCSFSSPSPPGDHYHNPIEDHHHTVPHDRTMQVNRGFPLDLRDGGEAGALPMRGAGEAARYALLGFRLRDRRT